ncbi:MAG: calcium-binding protein, partial [Microcystis aeruginosa G13-07]|nr:calcium-binding protein [Microcystis aeruginosa SX13-11]NCR69473.1 calcium-binding protein [Microcystis aeruginosa LL11-07]NCS09454.1 calcium-binding protein [Microcystis aeruginosa G13-07]
MIVNFAIGETSKTVTIPIKDDLLDDNNETVHLVLSNPSLGTIVDPNNNTAILTIIDNEGTAGNDNLVGTAGNDVINGFAGNDAISGLAGNDYLIGEAGNDVLYGGDGNDTLDGGTGDDYLLPGSGINTVIGGTGTDRLDLDYSTATTDVTVTYNDSNNGTISDGST